MLLTSKKRSDLFRNVVFRFLVIVLQDLSAATLFERRYYVACEKRLFSRQASDFFGGFPETVARFCCGFERRADCRIRRYYTGQNVAAASFCKRGGPACVEKHSLSVGYHGTCRFKCQHAFVCLCKRLDFFDVIRVYLGRKSGKFAYMRS